MTCGRCGLAWQALYGQAVFAPSSAQGKRARGRSRWRFKPAGNEFLERFLSRTAKALKIALARALIGFIGMVFDARPNFIEAPLCRNPAASTVTLRP